MTGVHRIHLLRGAALLLLFATIAMPRYSAIAATPWSLLAGLALASTLVGLSLIDIETQRLPDVLTIPLLAAGLLLATISGGDALLDHAAAAALGYGAFRGIAALYRARRGVDGLGGGDAKLLAAGGAWVGLTASPTIVLIGSIAALAWIGLRRLLGQSVEIHQRIAFGPFLALGIWYAWVFGPLAFG